MSEKLDAHLGTIRKRYMDAHSGGCRILSQGDGCDCTLCLCDRIKDLFAAGIRDRDRLWCESLIQGAGDVKCGSAHVMTDIIQAVTTRFNAARPDKENRKCLCRAEAGFGLVVNENCPIHRTASQIGCH